MPSGVARNGIRERPLRCAPRLLGLCIAVLGIHDRRVKLSVATEALAAALSGAVLTDVWSMARIVAESLGEPAGKAFEDALLEFLRTAKDPPP